MFASVRIAHAERKNCNLSPQKTKQLLSNFTMRDLTVRKYLITCHSSERHREGEKVRESVRGWGRRKIRQGM